MLLPYSAYLMFSVPAASAFRRSPKHWFVCNWTCVCTYVRTAYVSSPRPRELKVTVPGTRVLTTYKHTMHSIIFVRTNAWVGPGTMCELVYAYNYVRMQIIVRAYFSQSESNPQKHENYVAQTFWHYTLTSVEGQWKGLAWACVLLLCCLITHGCQCFWAHTSDILVSVLLFVEAAIPLALIMLLSSSYCSHSWPSDHLCLTCLLMVSWTRFAPGTARGWSRLDWGRVLHSMNTSTMIYHYACVHIHTSEHSLLLCKHLYRVPMNIQLHLLVLIVCGCQGT